MIPLITRSSSTRALPHVPFFCLALPAIWMAIQAVPKSLPIWASVQGCARRATGIDLGAMLIAMANLLTMARYDCDGQRSGSSAAALFDLTYGALAAIARTAVCQRPANGSAKKLGAT
jgi:hypothetical protein